MNQERLIENAFPFNKENRFPEQIALSTIVAAFEADPPVRWPFPKAEIYAEHFPAFAPALGGAAFRDGTLALVDGTAALWVRPDSEPDKNAKTEIFGHSVPENRQEDVFAVFKAMGEHHPETPHWYLPIVGVTPEKQGGGLGPGCQHTARPLQNGTVRFTSVSGS